MFSHQRLSDALLSPMQVRDSPRAQLDQAFEIMEEEEMKLTEGSEEILDAMCVGILEEGQVIRPLKELNPGEQATIAYLAIEDQRRLHKLMAMGALPGLLVTLIQKFPSYVFKLGESQFAIDGQMAEGIYVCLKKS